MRSWRSSIWAISAQNYAAGEEVNAESLKAKNLAKGRYDGSRRSWANGELTKKLKISAHRFGAAALEKIKQAGGEVVVIPAMPVVKGVRKGLQVGEGLIPESNRCGCA